MSLPRWARHEIVLERPGTKTVFGTEEESWADDAPGRTSEKVKGCWTWPASTEEITARGRDTTVDGWNVNLPPGGQEISSNWRIKLPNGHTYEIVGEVRDWPSATGATSYRSLYCERVQNRG